MKRIIGQSQVYGIADLNMIMRALEIANPAYVEAFDVLRISLGIVVDDDPKTIWDTPTRRIGRMERKP